MTITLIICSILLLLLIIIVFTARKRIVKQYDKYLSHENSCNLNGIDLANFYADKLDMGYLTLALSDHKLSDAYIPKKKIIVMSKELAGSKSLTTLAIVSHEFGHAVQDKRNERLFGLVNILFRLSVITNKFVGLFLTTGIIGSVLALIQIIPIEYGNTFLTLIIIGISLLLLNLLIKVLSIPMEYGASKKALKLLKEYKLITKQEERKVKKILRTAALTYIASLFDGIFIFKRKIARAFASKK